MKTLILASRKHLTLAMLFSTTLLGGLESSTAANYTWSNAGTDWNSTTSWTAGTGTPSAGGDVAIFNTTAVTNPNLSASMSISRITANSSTAASYTLSSSNNAVLTLGSVATGTSAAINYTPASGSFTIDAPIVLGAAANSTQSVNVNSDNGTVIINGPISSTNLVTLQKSGTGRLVLTGANSYTGGTLVSAGTLALSGSGNLGTGTLTLASTGTLDISAISGSSYSLTQTVNASGTVNATGKTLSVASSALNVGGASAVSLFTVTGALSLGSNNVTNLEITGISSFDQIDVSNLLTLDGSIVVTSSYTFALGDSFDLLDWGTLDSSGFSVSSDLLLPALSNGLSWDTSAFLTSGTVSVVPEPNIPALMGLGVLLLWGAMRRRQCDSV